MAASLMPNVALNTLLRCGSGGNDGKISCESLYQTDRLAATDACTNDEQGDDHMLDPSDSFCLSMEDELDWLDLHGHGQVAFFDRSHSTKAAHLNPPSSRSASFSAIRKKAAGAFFVFPKLPDSGELARPSHRRPYRLNKSSSRTIFPPIAEPGSPKVTCIGRVRPIREKGAGAAALHRKKSKREPPSPEKKKKAKSLWTPLAAVFRFRRLQKRGQESGRRGEESTPPSGSPAIGAPALGDMRKFESGRRPPSYGEAAEPVWRRRAAPPPATMGCGRDWGDAGPATK